MLNVLELVAFALIVVALAFYLFYWNRFCAFLISLVVRFALWNQGEASAWVKIGLEFERAGPEKQAVGELEQLAGDLEKALNKA